MKAVIMMMSFFASTSALAQSRQARACDSYIAQYCADSQDHGPGCLKGHESDVSAACLEDLQKAPPAGAHKGPPPQDGSGQSSQ